MAQLFVRTLKYRKVQIIDAVSGNVVDEYTRDRDTTPQKEVARYMKANPEAMGLIATVETVEERRGMSLDKFLEHSDVLEDNFEDAEPKTKKEEAKA